MAVPAEGDERPVGIGARPGSAGGHAGGGSSRYSPVARDDLAPRPASFGQRRLGVGGFHAPDTVLPEGQGEPGELPFEPRAAGGLWREQRELLTGRRGGAVEFQRQPRDRGRWRGPLEAREQQALDPLGVVGRFREALLDVQASAGVPARAKARSRSRWSRAREAARPRAVNWAVSAAASRWRTKRSGSRSSTASSMGRASRRRFGGLARAERLEDLAARPGMDACALLAKAGDERRAGGSSATAPIRRRPKRVEPGTHVGVEGVEEAGRMRGEELGLGSGCDEDGVRPVGPGRRRPSPRTVSPAMPARTSPTAGRAGPADPRSACPSTSTSRPTRTGSAPHSASSPSTWTSNSPKAASSGSALPAISGLNAASASNAASTVARSASGSGSIKVASGTSRWALPGRRHPPPDAERPCFRVRVDDRARVPPRPAAQDERAGREGLGGSHPGEFEGEVWSVEMEEWRIRGSSVG